MSDKSAEHEASVNSLHRAAQIWCEDKHAKKVMDPDFAVSIAKALDETHAAGRAEVLAEVMPFLKKISINQTEIEEYTKLYINEVWEIVNDDAKQARRLIEKLKT